MSKVRDFRAATIENIRSNLVDPDPNWDAFFDFFYDVFGSPKQLEVDLSNFNDYMRRVCEINDITAEKLDQIVADVHAVETTYSAQIAADAGNFNLLAGRLRILTEEISKPDFETNFDPVAVGERFEDMLISGAPRDINGIAPDSIESIWNNMTSGELALIDPSKLSASLRDGYYDYLLKLYAQTKDPVLLEPISKMTTEDTRRLVFRVDGPYGGTQNIDAAASWNNPDILAVLNRYPDIMNQFCPNMSQQEIMDFLNNSNNVNEYAAVGCGYMAAANSIFMNYLRKPNEFEAIFGIPMFDANGNLNYQALALDIYCSVGNIGDGTFQDPAIEEYLRNRGIESATATRVTDQDNQLLPTQADFQNADENGQTIVLYMSPTYLYDANGNFEPHPDAAHEVVVTGIDADGNITVSSWGRIYTVHADDINYYGSIFYELIDYE